MQTLLLSFLVLSASLPVFGQGQNFQPRVAFTNSLATGVTTVQPDLLWWKFSEGSGTTMADTSTGGANGGTNNFAWSTVLPSGSSGFSASMSGAKSGSTTSTLAYGSATPTLCFWIYSTNAIPSVANIYGDPK